MNDQVPSKELMPCPLCGHEAVLREDPVHGEYWGQWDRVLWCSSSHCRLRISLPADSEDVEGRLRRRWNCRPAHEPAPKQPEFTHEDADLDNLLNATAALLGGNANMDTGIWWQQCLEAVEKRLSQSPKVAERLEPAHEALLGSRKEPSGSTPPPGAWRSVADNPPRPEEGVVLVYTGEAFSCEYADQVNANDCALWMQIPPTSLNLIEGMKL